MKNPVVIIDPRSSGVELAPAFQANGIPVIGVTFKPLKHRMGYGREVRESDFDEVIPYQPDLAEILKKHDPLGIIPGSEGGVLLADELSTILTPQMSNHVGASFNRLHKAHMQQVLREAHIPALKTLSTSDESKVEAWLAESGLEDSPLIIKPPISAGSEQVFHIPPKGDWRNDFRRVLSQSSNVTGRLNETVVVQEKAVGVEFAIGTVSAHGHHHLAHLIRYTKTPYNGRQTVYDHVEFVPFDESLHGELLEYTRSALDALGVRWGASHNEVILTPNGPRLIESVPRMTGGPVVHFAREATGSSQVEKWVEVFTEGDVRAGPYDLKKTVVPIFLRSPTSGIISNSEVLAPASDLSTFFEKYLWFKEGDQVPQTVDYITAIGLIALAGDRESVFADYKKVREMESGLQIRQSHLE